MGAIINFLTVIAGSALGLVLKRGIPERITKTLTSALGLAVIFLSVTGMFRKVDGYETNALITVISLAVGAIIGELLNIDGLVNRLGKYAESKMKAKGGFAEGFVSATLLFMVGAMSIIGPLESGLNGDNSMLFAKAILDGISALIFASSFGIGVMFSAIPVLVIEGGLTLLARFIAPVLSAAVIAETAIVGSVIILAIGFNMLGLTKIKAANLVPAVFIPLILCLFM